MEGCCCWCYCLWILWIMIRFVVQWTTLLSDLLPPLVWSNFQTSKMNGRTGIDFEKYTKLIKNCFLGNSSAFTKIWHNKVLNLLQSKWRRRLNWNSIWKRQNLSIKNDSIFEIREIFSKLARLPSQSSLRQKFFHFPFFFRSQIEWINKFTTQKKQKKKKNNKKSFSNSFDRIVEFG